MFGLLALITAVDFLRRRHYINVAEQPARLALGRKCSVAGMGNRLSARLRDAGSLAIVSCLLALWHGGSQAMPLGLGSGRHHTQLALYAFSSSCPSTSAWRRPVRSGESETRELIDAGAGSMPAAAPRCARYPSSISLPQQAASDDPRNCARHLPLPQISTMSDLEHLGRLHLSSSFRSSSACGLVKRAMTR